MKTWFWIMGARLFWRFSARWYGMTRVAPFGTAHDVERFESLSDLWKRIDYANSYAADGPIDNMTHPARVQYRIDKGQALGDCDDTAAWTACALLKSHLASDVYLVTLIMRNKSGEPEGHVYVVATDERVHGLCAIDYGMPLECRSISQSAPVVAEGYDCTPLHVSWFGVDRVRGDGLRLDRKRSGAVTFA